MKKKCQIDIVLYSTIQWNYSFEFIFNIKCNINDEKYGQWVSYDYHFRLNLEKGWKKKFYSKFDV